MQYIKYKSIIIIKKYNNINLIYQDKIYYMYIIALSIRHISFCSREILFLHFLLHIRHWYLTKICLFYGKAKFYIKKMYITDSLYFFLNREIILLIILM